MTMIYWADIEDNGVRIVDRDTHWAVITRDGVERMVYCFIAETKEAQQWLKDHVTDPLINTRR